MVGALYGGVILMGFALELGATPWHIGLGEERNRRLAQPSPIDGLKDALLIPLGRLRGWRLRPR